MSDKRRTRLIELIATVLVLAFLAGVAAYLIGIARSSEPAKQAPTRKL